MHAAEGAGTAIGATRSLPPGKWSPWRPLVGPGNPLSAAATCSSGRPALAALLSDLEVDAVCGPLVEGAFVALMVALQLDIQFTYSERFVRPTGDGLFPAGYRVPASLRESLRDKRVAIVNDVINAGSAIRGTFADLEESGAKVIAIGTLLVLGSAAAKFAASKNVPLHSLATLPNNLWTASECPLCASGVPLQDVAAFATTLRA